LDIPRDWYEIEIETTVEISTEIKEATSNQKPINYAHLICYEPQFTL
jgi:hypothetical protein